MGKDPYTFLRGVGPFLISAPILDFLLIMVGVFYPMSIELVVGIWLRVEIGGTVGFPATWPILILQLSPDWYVYSVIYFIFCDICAGLWSLDFFSIGSIPCTLFDELIPGIMAAIALLFYLNMVRSSLFNYASTCVMFPLAFNSFFSFIYLSSISLYACLFYLL